MLCYSSLAARSHRSRNVFACLFYVARLSFAFTVLRQAARPRSLPALLSKVVPNGLENIFKRRRHRHLDGAEVGTRFAGYTVPLSAPLYSASTTLAQDLCPLTSAALNLPPYLEVESFGRLGEEGYEFIDELATHAAGGKHGRTMTTQKGVYKERLLQVVSVATQVTISTRVQRYKLALRGRQEVEDQRTRSTSNTSTPMIWGRGADAQ